MHMEAPDCIVAFSFSSVGKRANGISAADAAIAVQILTSKGKELPLPVIAQKGVAAYFKSNPKVTPIVLEETNLYKAACEAHEHMQKNGWKICVVGSHADREELCVRIMQKLEAEVAGTITSGCYDSNAREFIRRHRWLSKCWRPLELFFYRWVMEFI